MPAPRHLTPKSPQNPKTPCADIKGFRVVVVGCDLNLPKDRAVSEWWDRKKWGKAVSLFGSGGVSQHCEALQALPVEAPSCNF